MALPKYEGHEVVESEVALYGAGDGLSAALEIDPIVIKHGQHGYMLVEWECRDVAHPAVKKGDYSRLKRKHSLSTVTATVLASDEEKKWAQELLAERADAIQRAQDSMVGQGRLDDDESDE